MPLDHLNPDTLFASPAFTQVVTASGSRTIYVSGQVAWDKDDGLVGEGDFAAQAKKAYENLAAALDAAGATPDDVAKTTVYIVDYSASDPSMRHALDDARSAIFNGPKPPASTLIGVQALAFRGLMIEVEAIAVLD